MAAGIFRINMLDVMFLKVLVQCAVVFQQRIFGTAIKTQGRQLVAVGEHPMEDRLLRWLWRPEGIERFFNELSHL